MKQLILSTCVSGLLFVSGGCSRLFMGQWEVHQKVDPLDDSRIVFMSLLAENKIGLTRPRLLVRCKEGFTDVFIEYGSSLTPWLGHPYDDITVWTRFDESPARKNRWIVEPNTRRAIVAPVRFGIDSPFTALLARRSDWAHEIASAQKLFVRVIPESGRAMDATFQLKGAEKAIRPLREACGW